jgi:hypothetical protein
MGNNLNDIKITGKENNIKGYNIPCYYAISMTQSLRLQSLAVYPHVLYNSGQETLVNISSNSASLNLLPIYLC